MSKVTRMPEKTRRAVARETTEEETRLRKLQDAAEAARELGEILSRIPEDQTIAWIREDHKAR